MRDREGKSEIERTEQHIQNWSFDEEFKISAVEGLTYNPVTGNLERATGIQGNGSIVLEYTGGNLTKITKTIGDTSYEKTLSYTNGSLTGVSTWSKV